MTQRIIWTEDAELPWEFAPDAGADVEVKQANVLDGMVCFTFRGRYWRVPLRNVCAIDVGPVELDEDDES